MKTNQKMLCKRHYPFGWVLYKVGMLLINSVLPWVMVVMLCALAAQMVVEFVTMGGEL